MVIKARVKTEATTEPNLEVDAIQFDEESTETNAGDIAHWCAGSVRSVIDYENNRSGDDDEPLVRTCVRLHSEDAEGDDVLSSEAWPTDWVVYVSESDRYVVMSNDAFRAKYELEEN